MSSILGRPGAAALGRLLDHLGPRADLARAARRYVDRYEGVNNDDPSTNGEHWLIEQVLDTTRPVVFDVGANEGRWLEAVLERRPDASAHCFEASAATFQQLQARAGSRARLNRVALGAEAGEARLLVFENGSGMNSLYRREGLEAGWGIASQAREERVEVSTLDDYCRANGVRSIRLLKLDVEGSELNVMHGASALLSRGSIDVVQFEYGGCNIDARVLLKDIFAVLAGHGYRLYRLLPRGLRAYPRYDQRVEDCQHANWVALAPGVDAARLGVVSEAPRSS